MRVLNQQRAKNATAKLSDGGVQNFILECTSTNIGINIKYVDLRFKLDLYDKKQPTNILKIRILSETSILYLIRHASVIQFADLHL